MEDTTRRAEQLIDLLHSTLDEFTSAAIFSTQCDAACLSFRQCTFGSVTVHWLHLDERPSTPPRPTEFHRRHGIPENASLLDYVVIAGFRDWRYRVSVRHRHCTPELREFFERVDVENLCT